MTCLDCGADFQAGFPTSPSVVLDSILHMAVCDIPEMPSGYAIPQLKILQLGFSGCCYNSQYFNHHLQDPAWFDLYLFLYNLTSLITEPLPHCQSFLARESTVKHFFGVCYKSQPIIKIESQDARKTKVLLLMFPVEIIILYVPQGNIGKKENIKQILANMFCKGFLSFVIE